MPFKPLIELVRRPGFTFEPPERVNVAMWAMPGVERYKIESQVLWRFKHHGFTLNFIYFEDHQGKPHMRVMASRPSVHEGQFFFGGFDAQKEFDILDVLPGKQVQLVLDGRHRVVGGTEDEKHIEIEPRPPDRVFVHEKPREVSATKATVNEVENLLRQVGNVLEKRGDAIFPEEPKPDYSFEGPMVRVFRRFFKEKQDPKTLELIRKAKAHVLSLLEHVQTEPLR